MKTIKSKDIAIAIGLEGDSSGYIGSSQAIQLTSAEIDDYTRIQFGVLDPFAENGSNFYVLFFEIRMYTNSTEVRPTWASNYDYCCWWKDGELDLLTKIKEWYLEPNRCLSEFYAVFSADAESRKNMRYRFFETKRNRKIPPLQRLVMSLMCFHLGDFCNSLLLLKECIGVFLSLNNEQKEWRNKHYQALISKIGGKQ